ncbi:MAG: hypothetical protein AAFU85_33300, partial [Planctomycetota bacterium]
GARSCYAGITTTYTSLLSKFIRMAARAESPPISRRSQLATAMRRVLMVLAMFAVIVVLQRQNSQWPVKLLGANAAADGTILVSLLRNQQLQYPEIWHWDKTLRKGSRWRTLRAAPARFESARAGSVWLILGDEQLRAFDTQTKTLLWRRLNEDSFFEIAVLNDTYVLYVDDLYDPVIRVIDALSGKDVSQWKSNGKVKRYVIGAETLLIEESDRQVVLRWTGAELVEVENPKRELSQLWGQVSLLQAEIWEPDSYRVISSEGRSRRLVRPSKPNVLGTKTLVPKSDGRTVETTPTGRWRDGAEIRVVASDGTVLHRRVLNASESERSAIAALISLVVTAVVLVGTYDGLHASNPWRPFFDGLILLVFFAVCFCAWDRSLWPANESRFDAVRALPSVIASASCLAFLGLAATRRKFYVWLALLFACCLVFLVPPVIVALIRRHRGFRWPTPNVGTGSDESPATRSRGQFGIADVMLATTGVALLLAVSTASGAELMMNAAISGVVFGVLVAVGFVIMRSQGFAWFTLAVACFLSCQSLQSRDPSIGMWMAFSPMILMVFAFLSIRVPVDCSGNHVEPAT